MPDDPIREDRARLMAIGPCELHPEELRALGSPVIPHFGEVWAELHHETLNLLVELLGCSQEPYLIPGSGSMCLEAAILNLFQPGETVVVPDTGFFGQRLIQIAQRQRLDVVSMPVKVGSATDPDTLAYLVEKTRAVGVIATHVETSTGVRHPISEIAAAAHSRGAICLVDAMASAGGENLNLKEMNLDALVTCSQKGLDAAAGIGILALGSRAQSLLNERSTTPQSWCLDLKIWDKFRHEHSKWHPHPVTMPTNIVLTLLSSLRRISGIGIDEVVNRRSVLAKALRSNLAQLGLRQVPEPGLEANLVSVVWSKLALDIERSLFSSGIQVSRGLPPLADVSLRIGLIGASANARDINRVTELIADATLCSRNTTYVVNPPVK
jgi:alanine-glyoxylate transaminase / serine-glyoxylate transaminase / serine-pyruvate transaminase